ncbi:acid-sensing ion channel 1C-like [Exaiptasia diaphana]|uniref:Uncharacterized protein n=1 Tax=Exaiptasia diaphana TaxID=2652724 RepID=A0A913YQ14_EXADI|nr:acid-sensing ion channel 1C-like [Exaiptasia diaphana]
MSESYWKDYTEMILKKYSTVPQHLTESEFKKNQLIFIIQYEDLYTHKTTERERYSINDFGSDVGGNLGLFLGCSILTFFEIFDLIISYVFGRQKPKNQVEQDEAKNEITS